MGAAIFGGKHGKNAESDVAGRFTGMDALLALKLEDEQAKLNVEELLERHRAAVKHVYEHVYLFAPVKQGTDRFPADSPKAGQRYTWLTLDDKQNFNETKDYPDGVAVDERGNIFVSQRAGMPTRLITADEIKASECVPPAPPPPRLVKTESTRLSVSWQRVVCLVTRYELSWQALDAATGRPGKAGWQEGGAVPASSTAVNARAIENLVCCTPYEVRVRAKNLTGWGEWSAESLLMLTAAGAAGMCPSAVALVRATTTEVELGWPVAPRNGEDIVQYLLQWRGATDPPEDPWREAIVVPPPREQGLLLEDGLRGQAGGDGAGAGGGVVNRLSYTLEELTPWYTYYVRARGENSIGVGPFTEASIVRTKMPEVKLPPKALRTSGDWCEYWDKASGQCVYVNKVSGDKCLDVPAAMVVTEADRVLDFRKKRFRLQRVLRKVQQESNDAIAAGGVAAEDSFDAPGSPGLPARVVQLLLHRDNMVDETWDWFEQMEVDGTPDAILQKVRIEFVGEDGIDSGGLTKDWFLQVSRSMGASKRGLFRSSSAAAGGANKGGFLDFDHTQGKSEERLSQVRFLGKFVAKAIVDRQHVDLNLATATLKHVLNLPLGMDDLDELDPIMLKSLRWMLDNKIAGIIDETFSVCYKSPEAGEVVVDLVPHGRNNDVTDRNKEEYVDLLVQWLTKGRILEEMNAFLNGFYDIIPYGAVRAFTPEQLRLLVNGKSDVDVAEMKNGTIYRGGFLPDADAVTWFWQVRVYEGGLLRTAVLLLRGGSLSRYGLLHVFFLVNESL